jgi:hypothetical protein
MPPWDTPLLYGPGKSNYRYLRPLRPLVGPLVKSFATGSVKPIGSALLNAATSYLSGSPAAGAGKGMALRIRKRLRSRRPIRRRVRARPIRRRPRMMARSRRGVRRGVRKSNVVTATWKDVNTAAYQAGSISGHQGVFSWGIMNKFDVQRIFQKACPTFPGNLNQRMLLSSLSSDMLITNSQLGTAHVEVYTLRSRMQCNDVANGLDPGTAWSQGVTDINNTITFAEIGVKPFDSVLFKTNWRVVNKRVFTMEQGATRRFSDTFRFNKQLNGEEFNRTIGTIPAGITDAHGYTYWYMVVVRGQPTSSGTSITLTECKIDMINTTRVNYHTMPDWVESITYVDGLSSLVGANIVSKGAGAIMANAAT